MEKYGYRFSFGPWNIHEGADPFGPPVRPAIDFDDKLPIYKDLGFDAVQFHDDDAVPNLDDLTPAQIREEARAVRLKLADYGPDKIREFVDRLCKLQKRVLALFLESLHPQNDGQFTNEKRFGGLGYGPASGSSEFQNLHPQDGGVVWPSVRGNTLETLIFDINLFSE